MKKASLATLFLTVFLDLLGYGLVVPFLPRIAREYGANDAVATLIGTSYSLMQFLFIPIWGRLSDRIGRRPVLLVSIAGSAIGMAILGFAESLPLLFAGRILSGIFTANIAVAQAYVADVTDESNRAKGMGIIGVGFGLGFVFGPYLGGELSDTAWIARPGALAAFAAAGLSLLNFALALRNVPESLPVERRGARVRSSRPFDLSGLKRTLLVPGVWPVLLVNFMALLAFSGMEQTFALFTEDGFGMGEKPTGRILGFVGMMLVIVQGGLIKPLSKKFGEALLIRAGTAIEALAFFLMGMSPDLMGGSLTVLLIAAGGIAIANGLINPSIPSYASKCSDAANQGTTLGALQSLGALARVLGPLAAGILYENFGYAPMFSTLSAVLVVGALFALALRLPLARRATGDAAVTPAE